MRLLRKPADGPGYHGRPGPIVRPNRRLYVEAAKHRAALATNGQDG